MEDRMTTTQKINEQVEALNTRLEILNEEMAACRALRDRLEEMAVDKKELERTLNDVVELETALREITQRKVSDV